jgi:hypothetical protein
MPAWYGILSETGSKAAFWNGPEWADYPVRANMRFNEGFRHESDGLRLGEITTGSCIKFATARPYANPEAAARNLIEIANSVEAVQDGRIFMELINGPFLFERKVTPAEYSVGLKLAIERGWLEIDRSGTFVRFTQARAELFA